MADLTNRDPNDLNSYAKCEFEDILGEPEGVKSIDCIWKFSFLLFNCSKGFYYKLMTLFCGLCYAFFWGCDFAAVAFSHVWCITPGLKMGEICCVPCRKMVHLCVDSCVGPCCETCGLVLSRIAITKK